MSASAFDFSTFEAYMFPLTLKGGVYFNLFLTIFVLFHNCLQFVSSEERWFDHFSFLIIFVFKLLHESR